MIPSDHGLATHDLHPTKNIYWNASVPELVEFVVRRGEGELTQLGAVRTLTGKRTGRSPKDKFIVRDTTTETDVAWGNVNRPTTPVVFDRLLRKTIDHLNARDLFVTDAWAGADPDYGMPIRVVGTYAWHALFARQLFRRPTTDEIRRNVPQFLILAAPECLADPATDGTNSETYVVVNFSKKIALIGGTKYAGEIKKSIFTVLNFVLPPRGVFPMHCSANVGADGGVALFFGLSGTGKTTLSADPSRRLIGDDEHGWSDQGVFNFEGGCYAKCIRLSPKYEPQIYQALKFGVVLENVDIDEQTRVADFDSAKYTENTRAAYPVEHIDGAVPEGLVQAHPRAVVFLTCDAFGVLPPVSRLTTDQAMYHFLSGYTAKVAGTEAGLGNEPQATFSTGFGEPFLPRSPISYARLLADKITRHKAACYLVNTGWGGGPFGVGKRIDLTTTRAIVKAAVDGTLAGVETSRDPIFGLPVPVAVPGVDTSLLMPRKTWKDPAAYDAKAHELADRFVQNFRRFPDAPDAVRDAGPQSAVAT